MFKQRSVLANTIIALFLSQLIFWLIFLNFKLIPPEVPLWHLQSWGESQLASKGMIWLLPGLSVGILAVDLLITTLIYRKQPFIVGIIMATSSIASVYLLLATINLLQRVLGWW